eukprot:scaffold64677_cov30-Tisochrysis_lutea.AAC.2
MLLARNHWFKAWTRASRPSHPELQSPRSPPRPPFHPTSAQFNCEYAQTPRWIREIQHDGAFGKRGQEEALDGRPGCEESACGLNKLKVLSLRMLTSKSKARPTTCQKWALYSL